MRKRAHSPLRLSLLSYAIAAAAAGGLAQSAAAVDLCTGQSSITVSQANENTSCSLDTSGATLTVTEAGAIDRGVYASVTNSVVDNAGTISNSITNITSGTPFASASVYAAGIGTSGNQGAALTNSGTIIAGAHAEAAGHQTWVTTGVSGTGYYEGGTAYATATADGIRVEGSSLIAISNSGLIQANATAGASGDAMDASHAKAYGIAVNGDIKAGLNNTGSLSAGAEAQTAEATAVQAAAISGTFGNTGSIGAEAGGVRATAKAITAGSLAAGSVLDNSGEIGASAYGSSAQATAVYLGTLSGRISNSGSIGASISGGSGSGSAAKGLLVDLLNAGGSIVNAADSGISANGYAYGYNTFVQGIGVGTLKGSIDNAGGIYAGVGGYYGNAEGIGVETLAAGSVLNNSGEISASGYGYSADATAVNLGTVAGRVTNSGDISAGISGGSGSGSSANGLLMGLLDSGASLVNGADASISAYGGYYGYGVSTLGVGVGSLKGTVDNAGGIHASAYGYGVHVSGVQAGAISGVLRNAGAISASGGGYYANAQGLSAESLAAGGLLDNSGEISASGNGYSASATAVNLGELSGRISNSGDISASIGGSGSGPSFYASSGSGSGNNGSAHGLLIGLLNTGGSLANAADASIGAYGSGYNISSVGVGISSLEGSVTNAGNFSAVANGYYGYSSQASATAFSVESFAGSLANSGEISAHASGFYADAVGANADYAFIGTLTNQADGLILAQAYSNRGADATGVRLQGSSSSTGPALMVAEASGLSGSLINNGDIVANASAYSWGYAYGVEAQGPFAGRLTNNGSIQAEASSRDAYAVGVMLAGGKFKSIGPMMGSGITGTVANYGDITAQAYGSYANARGIAVQGLLEGSLLNAGNVEANATDAYNANATAVDIGGLTGTLANNGSISAYAQGNYAHANGVRVMSLEGAATNNGDIYAGAEGYWDAYAVGINASVSGGASLTNNRSITADASSSSSGQAIGVQLYEYTSASPFSIAVASEGPTPTFVNNGEVSASITADYASATGLLVSSSYDGSLTNTKKLNAYAEGTVANAAGVRVSGMLSGSLKNSGTITAFAKGSTGAAYGVLVSSLSGTLENTGTIAADADFSDGGSIAAVYVDGGNGQVINSGLIDGGVRIYGGVALENSGTIVLAPNAAGFVSGDYTQLAGGRLAFKAVSSTEYGTFSNGGTADFTAGNNVHVQVDPANTLVNGDRLNNVLVSDSLVLPASGKFLVTDSTVFWNFTQEVTGGALSLTATKVSTDDALAGAGLSDTQVNLVKDVIGDMNGGTYSDFAQAIFNSPTPQAVADVLQQVGPVLPGAPGNAARAAAQGAGNAIISRLNAHRGAASGDESADNAVWIKPFLGKATQDAVGTLTGYDVDGSGFVIGVDGNVSDSWRLGLAVASSKSDVESGVANINAESTHMAVYASYALSETAAVDLDVNHVAVGYDSSRWVGFVSSTARANFDGKQVGAGVTVSNRIGFGKDSAFEPSLSVRYTRVELDGYNETGAGIYNLTVADSSEDSMLWAAKGNFEFGVGKGVVLANAGVGYDTLDAAQVTATFSGAGPTFVSTGIDPDSTVLMGGVGYRYVTSKNLEIDATYDVENRGDFTAQTASVKFKLPL